MRNPSKNTIKRLSHLLTCPAGCGPTMRLKDTREEHRLFECIKCGVKGLTSRAQDGRGLWVETWEGETSLNWIPRTEAKTA